MLQKPFEVPILLKRGVDIQNGKEWEVIQNEYAKQKFKVDNNKDIEKSLLQMSELFIQEARVTGEHGHYYPAALQCLNYALSSSEIQLDEKFMALTIKAGVQLSLHEFEMALQTAKEALVLNGHNARIYGVLVDAYVELGDYESAIKAADKMVSIKPDLRSYSRVSYLREIHGDLDGAISALVFAIQSSLPGEERRAWAMLHLGSLYEKQNKNDFAAQVYSNCLTERPRYPFAIDAMGQLEFKKGNISKAVSYFKDAISVIPEVGFYMNLAEAYKEKGDKQKFQELIDEIFVMLEDDIASGHNMNFELAEIYFKYLSDTESALEIIEEEYKIRPGNVDVNKMLWEIYDSTGNTKRAQKHLTAIKKVNTSLVERHNLQQERKQSKF